MEVKQLTRNISTDFNRTITLVGVIPLLVFIYLLIGKISNVNALAGEVGYIVLATIGVFVMGVVVGRRMLMSVTLKLIDDNQRILSMQQEMMNKNRLVAVTETVLGLSDKINNPLLALRGNLDLLEMDFKQSDLTDKVKKRFAVIKSSCETIREVSYKLAQLTKPVSTYISDDIRMMDLDKSE